MQNEYIIAFSSFYKAAYAQELLEAEGIRSNLRKLPIDIAKSCSTGLAYKGNAIQRVKEIFSIKGIQTRGIYKVDRENKEKIQYILIR